jgi:TPR repeat protein
MAKDNEKKAIILAAARAALEADGKFTVRGICAATGVARSVITRHFGGKEGLVAALLAEDVKDLSGIAAPPKETALSLPQAVGENIFYIDSMAATAAAASAREPRIPRRGEVGRVLEERKIKDTEAAMKAEAEAGRAPDAWLERRLRVFERALNNIELREEKSEHERISAFGGLEESVRALREDLAKAEARRDDADLALRAQLDAMTMRVAALELARLSDAPQIAPTVPQAEEQAEDMGDTIEWAQARDGEFHAIALPDESGMLAPQEAPSPPEPSTPVTESFIAQARRSAQAAQSLAEEAEPARGGKISGRWFAAAAVVLVLLIASATIAFGKFSHGDATPAMAANGVTHRHLASTPAARLRVLADGGDATARTIVALHYLHGEGVPQSDTAAARWIVLAAAQGQPLAQYVLGTLYQQGSGVTRDPHAAFRWFQAAARQGNRRAMHNLAIAYIEGAGVAKDASKAAQWFASAARLGYGDSQFDLAVLYERGEGVPQSLAKAYQWYAIAAAQGDAPSAARIKVLRTQMTAAAVAAAARAAKAFVPAPFDPGANGVSGKV